jgi:uncharacterized membrane-anchored protein
VRESACRGRRGAADVRRYAHDGLIEAGDLAGARSLAEEMRRSKPTHPDVYIFMADDYEAAGDLAEANRWINLGLRPVAYAGRR